MKQSQIHKSPGWPLEKRKVFFFLFFSGGFKGEVCSVRVDSKALLLPLLSQLQHYRDAREPRDAFQLILPSPALLNNPHSEEGCFPGSGWLFQDHTDPGQSFISSFIRKWLIKVTLLCPHTKHLIPTCIPCNHFHFASLQQKIEARRKLFREQMAASIQLQAGKVQSAGAEGEGPEILHMSDLGLKLSISSHMGGCWWHHVPVLLLQPPPGAAGDGQPHRGTQPYRKLPEFCMKPTSAGCLLQALGANRQSGSGWRTPRPSWPMEGGTAADTHSGALCTSS